MFQLDIFSFGQYTARRYYTEDNSISFTIIPECGALLNDYQFNGHPIIDGCKTPREVESNNWCKSWLLFPFPNRLKDGRYTWQDNTYQFPINETQNQHALHGFLHECAFVLVEEAVTATQVVLRLQYEYAGKRVYYPFPFLFEIGITADTQGRFRMEATITNCGTQEMPMGFGWHPYFQLGGKINDWQLKTSPIELIGIDQRMIPTGKKYDYDTYANFKTIKSEVLDNCFEGRGKFGKNTEVQLTDGRLRLTVSQPTIQFPYLQLFTPPSRQSIAIEPMTCNVDAFNNGDRVIELKPKESWWGTYFFKIASV
ncbi:MAG: aldose 1-epimerase [Bacteroidota bacterium]